MRALLLSGLLLLAFVPLANATTDVQVCTSATSTTCGGIACATVLHKAGACVTKDGAARNFCVYGEPGCYGLICSSSGSCIPYPCQYCVPLSANPGPQCMERYWRADIGPVTIVSTDSCHYDVQLDGDWVRLA